MSAGPRFEIETSDEGRRRSVVVRGELDMATVPDVRAALRRAAREAQEVLLDLREVVFVDSSGISLLVGVDAESRRDGFGFALLAGEPVLRVIDLCGLRDVLPLRDG